MGRLKKLLKRKAKKMKNTKKDIKGMLKKLGMMIFIILCINLISAETGFLQKSAVEIPGVVDNHIYIIYATQDTMPSFVGSLLGAFGITNNLTTPLNFVPSGKPYEVSIVYSSDIKQWNINYPSNQVNYCKLEFSQQNILSGNLSIIFSQNYTETSDVNDRYFFKLNDGDYVTAYFICYFASNYTGLDLPVSMYAQAPSWECKACQFSDWAKLKGSSLDISQLNNSVGSIQDYIQKLMLLVFEFVVYMFWVFLIAFLFFAVGMIFWGVYWVYFYIINVIK